MRLVMLCVVVCLAACGRDGLSGVDAGAGGGAGGGNTGGGGGASCVGLTMQACRARPDCEPDTCYQCTCAPIYEGCRAKTAQPFQCPRFGCAQPMCCQDQATCANVGSCAPPGTPSGCGACNNQPETCTSDAACAGDEICEVRTCACGGERDCRPGCSATNPCAEGLTCTAKRCVPTTCADASQCPATFGCEGLTCTRRTCSTDLACGDGYCVDGACYAAQGECRLPTP